jgi:head-tail adaptor
MRSGARNYIVTFQTSSEVSDGIGAGGTVSWADSFSCWAAIWGAKASEQIEAGINRQTVVYRIRVNRNGQTMTASAPMRIKWENWGTTRYLEIVSVRPVGERLEELEILAEEKN